MLDATVGCSLLMRQVVAGQIMAALTYFSNQIPNFGQSFLFTEIENTYILRGTPKHPFQENIHQLLYLLYLHHAPAYPNLSRWESGNPLWSIAMHNNPLSAQKPEYEGLAAQFDAAKRAQAKQLATARSRDSVVRKRNLQQQRAFKYSHGLLVALLLFFVYLHGVGIFLFTKGFLLTRLVLGEKSTCDVSPLQEYGSVWIGGVNEGCWHPKTFDRAVIVVIDALRFDFTIPFEPKDNSTPTHLFHNAFTTPYRIASQSPKNAVLLPFIADPPTTTLQRLKGLTTGTLPTFIDAGSNFAGNSIEEDNMISQLHALGKRMAFMGDDTWMALFPGMFEPEMEHPYESLNVWDLHTVDNGVTEHIFPLLHPENQTKWDIAIGHYLGVDHAGHRYGPNHFAMNEKLKQMDDIVQRLTESIDDKTLLVVMGDHGMDSKGDHGGESQGEVEAALWLYSKKPVFGRFPEELSPNGGGRGAGSDGIRSVAQIDLVPTLSLLLGSPIPFNNLGAPIVEAFVGDGGAQGLQNLALVSRLTAAQIKRYQKEYAGKGGDVEASNSIGAWWDSGQEKWEASQRKSKKASRSEWVAVFQDFSTYQEQILKACRDVWASFDLVSMAAGIITLVGSVVALAVYARGFVGDRIELTDTLLPRMLKGLSAGAIGSVIIGFLVEEDTLGLSRVRLMLFSTSIGIILGFFSAMIYARTRLTTIWPNSGWGILSVAFTVTHSLIFASNSFTIWEDQILSYFLCTFAIGGLIASQRKNDIAQRMLGTYHSAVFFVLTRIASFSRLCREEQMPYCESTFYASATSSVSAPWSLALLLVMAMVLPSIIKSFYSGSKSYHGPAPVTIGWAFRVGLILSALYWFLDSADNGGWLDVSESLLKSSKTIIARIVLAIGLFAGNVAYAWATLCLDIEIKEKKSDITDVHGKITSESGKSVLLLGYANVHGSRYLLLVVPWALALILLQKPMGGASMGVLVWQIMSLLEIIDCNDLSDSAIGPIVLGLLGNSHFFSTGHQATLSSIQWESAFIPFSSIRYPWSPLLVIGNTLGPQILAALAVPLIALWKAAPKRAGLLGSVAVSGATHMLYHAVVTLSSVVCAGHLRRHLMLYRIFSPRFMLGAAVLLVVDAIVAFIAVGGVRWNTLAVAEIFGI